MPIDPSIYSQIQTPQAPDPLRAAEGAMTLSNLGIQQQQMAYQQAQLQATRQAFARNTDPATGQVNKQGILSDMTVGGFGPAAMQLGQQFAAHDKAQADAKIANAQAQNGILEHTLPVMKYWLSLPDDQAEEAMHPMLDELAKKGIPMNNAPAHWDRAKMQQMYDSAIGTEAGNKMLLGQAQIGETQAKTAEALANAGAPAPMKIGAEELGKFNEDVNNASSRKETGALMTTRDRADRLLTLANAGAPPNEKMPDRIARLNKTLPQLANEYSIGLASILQGGVPSDTVMKETGLDTAGSRIAELKQKWTADPTAGNQGALINAYAEAAQQMRDFSAGRLKEVVTRARAAYPFANKYYTKEMDQIGAQIDAPGNGSGGSAMAGGGTPAGGIISAANAGEKGMPSAHDTAALQWLKDTKTDQSSPKAFKVRAILKAKGLL